MKHEKISEKYRKWVIEFHSERFVNPVYFIWLTDVSDKNEQDQILLTKSQQIIAAKSDRKIIERVFESSIKLFDSKRMKKWLKESLNCKKNKFNQI